jgi:hypothetical protein
VFLGGFSAATSMVIVAALALSTMVSNHIIVPLWLRATRNEDPMSGDMRRVALMARRLSIGGILFLGLGYYRLSGGADALAEIGLIAFLGVAQVLPALLGGILWRGATRVGAAIGIGAGFAIWAWLLLIPNIAETGGLVPPVLDAGPFGLMWLSPATPLGLQATDPLLTAMILSLGVNTLLFILGSLFSFPSPLERLQGAQFVNVYDHSTALLGWRGAVGTADDLLIMAQRILGPARAGRLFQDAAGAGAGRRPARADAGFPRTAGAGACRFRRGGDGACDGRADHRGGQRVGARPVWPWPTRPRRSWSIPASSRRNRRN